MGWNVDGLLRTRGIHRGATVVVGYWHGHNEPRANSNCHPDGGDKSKAVEGCEEAHCSLPCRHLLLLFFLLSLPTFSCLSPGSLPSASDDVQL